MKHTPSCGDDEHDPDLAGALDELQAAAAALGWGLPRGGRDKLAQWAGLVVTWRARAGLTAARTSGAVVRELMVPVVYALPVVGKTETPRVLDLGCGNGCTGVTLAVVAARGRWHLVDRSEAKITFCRYALSRCRIPGVEAHTRQEAAARNLRADVVLARAIPRTPESLRDVVRFGKPGAVVIRWQSQAPQQAHTETMKCGDRNLWVVVDSVDSFT